MKQIFSSYPDGIVGIALIMLRGSAIALLLAVLQSRYGSFLWVQVATVVVAAALVIGLGTRLAVVFCALIAGFTLTTLYSVPQIMLIGQGLGLSGLLLLGPGAFSVDARLFGRRKISLK